MIVSRLAPSPTGSLHLGNARTFLWAWLSARAASGAVILRVEDLDTPRVKPGMGVIEKMLDDLRWLGLDWDYGPSPGRSLAAHGSYIQTQRRDFYRQIHAYLEQKKAVYPCICTRADLAAAQSAPHDGETELRYPGTCRGRFASAADAEKAAGRAPAWRLKVPAGPVAFDDLVRGPQSIDAGSGVGDFVVAKAPGNPAYQLAVAADDIAMGVTEVVRGDDLIPSTARQILVYRALEEHFGSAPLPRYGHVPLMVGPDGLRLAKRHGDARIASLREHGIRPGHIIGVLARWSGLDCPGEAAPRDLIPLWSWQKINRQRVTLTPEKLREIDPGA